MPDWSVLGMPLRPEGDVAQPLEAAVIIKGLDADGKIAYWTTCTEGLTSIEILGMCTWGAEVALRAGDDA
jgi:hypothetical protein